MIFGRKEPINEKVKKLLVDHLDPFLSEKSFARKGTDYRRSKGNCVQHLFFRFDMEGDDRASCYYFANLEYPAVEKLLEYGVSDADAVNTVGKQMGYLRAGTFEEWPLTPRTNVDDFAAKFIKHVDQCALPFLDKYSSMESVVEGLGAGETFNLDWRDAAMKLAAMLFLLGEKSRATEVLVRQEEKLRGHSQESRFIRFRNYLQSLA